MNDRFIDFWQHIPEIIDPVCLQLGPLQIRWYGLMYLSAFLVIYVLLCYRIKKESLSYSKDAFADFFNWVIIGVIVGARLGYVIFYNFSYFFYHPLEIVLPFQFEDGLQFVGISGLSYHGGLVGALVAAVRFCRKFKINFWVWTDFVIPAVPLGYSLGRLGNFLNGELFGRVTTQWWGMYFPQDYTNQLRHPSQLYELVFEGLILFVLCWSLRNKVFFKGKLLGVYLLGYASARFCIEYAREPDEQLGFIVYNLSMGQLLSSAMVVTALIILFKKNTRVSA